MFKIKTRDNGTYMRNSYGQVLVTGDPSKPEEMAWVSHSQLDELKIREARDEGNDLVTQAIQNQLADDPVVQAINAAKEVIAEAINTGEVPEQFTHKVMKQGTEGVKAEAEVVLHFSHDTRVILLIEAGAFDNLVWDTTQTGSQKIQVLF